MVNLTKLQYFTKSLTYISAGLLLFISIFQFFTLSINIGLIAQRIGFIIFSAKIVLCEMQIKWALVNFPYMRYYFGKSLFIIFCGTLLIKNDFDVQMIIGIVLIFVGLLFMVMAIFVKSEKKEGFQFE